METTVVFPLLLLLVCSVSTDQMGSETVGQSCPQDVHTVLRDLTASMAQQKMEIAFLQTQNQEQAAKLTELLNQKTQSDKRAQQVAFSASLSTEGEETLGPFQSHTPLIYRRVVTNFGSAYNSNTGVFTAPFRGVYHFDWHINQKADADHATGVDLMKNSDRVFMAYEHNSFGFGSSSNGVNLFLEVGETVRLRLWQETALFDNPSHHTTFSGHLLFLV